MYLSGNVDPKLRVLPVTYVWYNWNGSRLSYYATGSHTINRTKIKICLRILTVSVVYATTRYNLRCYMYWGTSNERCFLDIVDIVDITLLIGWFSGDLHCIGNIPASPLFLILNHRILVYLMHLYMYQQTRYVTLDIRSLHMSLNHNTISTFNLLLTIYYKLITGNKFCVLRIFFLIYWY